MGQLARWMLALQVEWPGQMWGRSPWDPLPSSQPPTPNPFLPPSVTSPETHKTWLQVAVSQLKLDSAGSQSRVPSCPFAALGPDVHLFLFSEAVRPQAMVSTSSRLTTLQYSICSELMVAPPKDMSTS